MTDPGRVYGGRSENERRADRRARLLAAGLEQFGTDGWNGTTIERLCAAAGVATRSFYEEFASREALLLAVYESIMTSITSTLVERVTAVKGDPVGQIGVALRGYVEFLTEDPRRSRVVHHEIRLAGGLEHHRQVMMVRFADLIATYARLPAPGGRVLGLALAGAVSEVLVDWVTHEEPRPDTDVLIDVLIDLYTAAMTAPSLRGTAR